MTSVVRSGCWTLPLVCLILASCGRPPAPPPAAEISVAATENSEASGKDSLPDPKFSPGDWPQWRGLNADGISAGEPVPVLWKDDSSAENIVWKVRIPGRGHSCPTILGDQIFMQTADEQQKTQSVLCLNRQNGQQLWTKELFTGGFETEMHPENTQASSTIACDGERLFAVFLNARKVWVIALNLQGDELWRTEAGSFRSKFGFSSSPTLYQSFILVSADHDAGGYLAAIHRKTGKIIWRKNRPAASSYASPRVVNLGGKDQLVICGADVVNSYNPSNGEQLWSLKGTTTATVGTMVTTNGMVFASGGYPGRDTVAITPEGTVAWRKGEKSYVPSLLAYKDHLYMVNDDGIAFCYQAATGQEMWKKRLGGNFRVSPVLNGEHIFTTDMQGKCTVFKADPAAFTIVAENQLGTEAFSTPVISRGQLFQRVADNSQGPRQEWLYCIGRKPEKREQGGG